MPLDQTELNMIRKSARQIADQFGPNTGANTTRRSSILGTS